MIHLWERACVGNHTLASGSLCKDAPENAANPPDAGNLDWDMNSDEITPRDFALFVRSGGPSVDIGAYERGPDSPPGGGEN